MSTDFHGSPTRVLENGLLRLEYLANAGPRIVRLSLAGSDLNLMAEVPDIRIPTPHGDFMLYGGHRLWHSPEAFPRSYLPDNEGLEVHDLENGVRLSQPVEPSTGIRKQMEVRLTPDSPEVIVIHNLENQGAWPVELAPWALTQLRLGGLLILPQVQGPLDSAGLLPNRNLVLWPYTRLADPRLSLNDDLVLIDAQAAQPPCKVGYMNRHGWLGYLVEGIFFLKRFEPQPHLAHVDFGCNTETYCNDRFIEAETVGPLARLEPGQALTHVERWSLRRTTDVPHTLAGARELVAALQLPVG